HVFSEPAAEESSREQRRRYPEATDAFFEAVMRSGQPMLNPRLTDEELQRTVVDDEQLRLLRAIGLRSYVTVPLLARGRTLGVLSLVSARSGRDFDEASLAIIKELASRAALAVDDAHLIQDLRSTRERFDLALDEGRMWYFELDLRTRQATYSPSFTRIVGMTDTRYEAFVQIIHPADRAAVQEHVRRLVTEGERDPYAYRIIRPDTGQVRWIEGMSRVIRDGAGQPVRVIGFRADVTERKEAEESIRRSEEQLRLALTAGRMGIFDWDMARGFTEMSPACQAILGLVPGTYDGSFEMFVGCMHPEDREPAIRAIQAPLEIGEEPRPLVYRVVHPGGEIRSVESHAKIMRGGDGRPVRVLGLIMDITERKEAEENIRRSEERLRLALNAGRMGVFDFDVRNSKLLISPTYEAMLGMAPGTSRGTLEHFFEHIHPEDREHVSGTIQAQLASGDVSFLLFRALHGDGAVRYIEAHGKIQRDAAGQPLRATGVALDITERKQAEESIRQSEERLRLVLTAGRTGFFDWDMRTGRGTFSEGYQAMLGMAPGSYDGTPEAFTRRLHPEDQPHILRAMQAYASGELDDSLLTYRAVHDDGSVRWVEAHSKSLRDGNGQVLRVFGVVVDITERKEAEAQAQRLAAEQAARAETEAARQRIAAILDSISEPLFALDPQWRFRFLNRPAEEMVGEGVTGRSAREVPPFRDAPALLASCETAMRERGQLEQEVELPGGRWYELRARPYEQGLSVYLRDVTARRREQEVQARLARYDALRADIASIWATHEDIQPAL
ncbi:MAG TPA: PAS domain-containing protein, partial [Myxococcaceae bacterium]|nr:PAS domain-containing protein [Myxococcaceae bacterium]